MGSARNLFSFLIVIVIGGAFLAGSPASLVTASEETSLVLSDFEVEFIGCDPVNYLVSFNFNVDIFEPGAIAEFEWTYSFPGYSYTSSAYPFGPFGPGPASITVGTGLYGPVSVVVPDHTPLSLIYRDIYSSAAAGFSVDCTTGEVINVWTSSTLGQAGPDMVALPDNAVVGKFLDWTPLYYLPAAGATSDYHMEPGQSLWVCGVDSSSQFYKVVMSGQFYWVPVSSMGPNYDDVWNGQPLPTTIVE